MTPGEMLKLAEYLRKLEYKLSNDADLWKEWVSGSLTSIAEMLELKAGKQ